MTKQNKPKTKRGRKKDAEMPNYDESFHILIDSIKTELEEQNMIINLTDQYTPFVYPKFSQFTRKWNILEKLKGKPFFGVFNFRRDRKSKELLISNKSVLKLSEEIWPQIYLNNHSVFLQPIIDKLTNNNDNLGPIDKKFYWSDRKSRIPKSKYEFKTSKYYVIQSELKTGQVLKENAKATPYTFEEQQVYKREDVLELYGKTRWRMKGRKIKEGELPTRTIPNVWNRNKLIDLYGEWQTEEIKWEIIDGKLPENEYGNIDLFAAPLPEELMILKEKGIWRVCKKLKIDYKNAISGFDLKKGRNVAIKEGIVVFKKDEPAIQKEWETMKKEIEKAEHEKKRKDVLNGWKLIFKTLLVKRYMNLTYN